MKKKFTLSELLMEHRGHSIDKWENYLGVYERELTRFNNRRKPIRLLEIGVQNGGSLELWSRYFPKRSEIFGIDIDPEISNLKFESDNIFTFIGDITDKKCMKNHKLKDMKFDIIIDDGSHKSSDIISSFNNLFNLLSPSGIYIIEDLHCSYMTYYEGGLMKEKSSIEYFKRIIDVIHSDHIDKRDLDSIKVPEMDYFSSWLARIAFYDSVAVVEKLSSAKRAPYRRIFGGVEAKVCPVSNWLDHFPLASLKSFVISPPAIGRFDKSLYEEAEKNRQDNILLKNKLKLLKEKIKFYENSRVLETDSKIIK